MLLASTSLSPQSPSLLLFIHFATHDWTRTSPHSISKEEAKKKYVEALTKAVPNWNAPQAKL